MIELIDSSFSPLETFKLQWRWTRNAILPEHELAQIHPLIEVQARAIWDETSIYWNQIGGYLLHYRKGLPPYAPKIPLFEGPTQVIPTKETSLSAQISQELLAFETQLEMQVIVMWGPTVAVATPWRLFCSYWDDFCYPSSDDIRIFPRSERWFLAYTHNDFFTFGRLYDPAQERELREQLALLTAPCPLSAESQFEIQRLLRTGEVMDKIAAIKLYSREAGVGLAKAKEVIDQMITEMKRQQEE